MSGKTIYDSFIHERLGHEDMTSRGVGGRGGGSRAKLVIKVSVNWCC